MTLRSIIIFAMMLSPIRAGAQDRRQVSEPSMPARCAALAADKTVGSDRQMAAADEARADTSRIQAALDRCPAGTMVSLVGDGAHNAFLTGPLQLP